MGKLNVALQEIVPIYGGRGGCLLTTPDGVTYFPDTPTACDAGIRVLGEIKAEALKERDQKRTPPGEAAGTQPQTPNKPPVGVR